MPDIHSSYDSRMTERWKREEWLIENFPHRPDQPRIQKAGGGSKGAGIGRRALALTVRLRGPGGLYNLGNAIALATGTGVQRASVPAGASYGAPIEGYFFGSAVATWLSFGVLMFFLPGTVCRRDWLRAYGARCWQIRGEPGAVHLVRGSRKYGDL